MAAGCLDNLATVRRREWNGGGVPELGKAKLAAEMPAARVVYELARTVMAYTTTNTSTYTTT